VYQINETSRQIVISMIRPRAQVSTYIDNTGKPADLKPGVQDPVRPKTKTTTPATPGTSTAPAASKPAATPTSGTVPQP
jgi:hypothetical protein